MAKLQYKPVKLGLEKILDEQVVSLKGMRVGLVCNPASVNHQFQHAADLFHEKEQINLKTFDGQSHAARASGCDTLFQRHSCFIWVINIVCVRVLIESFARFQLFDAATKPCIRRRRDDAIEFARVENVARHREARGAHQRLESQTGAMPRARVLVEQHDHALAPTAGQQEFAHIHNLGRKSHRPRRPFRIIMQQMPIFLQR